jgi:hypothetical protein
MNEYVFEREPGSNKLFSDGPNMHRVAEPITPPAARYVLGPQLQDGPQGLENGTSTLQRASRKRGRSEDAHITGTMGRLPSTQSIQDGETQSQE